ncbi:MAG: hypothetical protein NTX12_05990 [Actinobacteria bacterium]|nr:hypothetical protein [Actinomycetota bacterium]
MKTNLKMPDYVAGSCNIGGPEVQRRKNVGYAGALISLVTLVFLIATHSASGARTVIFFPFLLTSISWFQTRRRFCLAFGLAGTFNFGPAGTLAKVSDPADLRADRARAIKTLAQAFAYALFATVLVIILPF